jgi:uncharacterized protein
VLPVSPTTLALAALCTAVSALVQGTVGLGFAILSVPLLSLLDPLLAPVPQLIVSAPMTFWMAWRERSAIQLRGVTWVFVGRLPGTALGTWLLLWASQRFLDVFIGATVLGGALILGSGARIARTPRTEVTAGFTSGLASVVSAIGGPPLALLYSDVDGPTIRSTLATIFSMGMVLTLGARVAAGKVTATDLTIALWLLPALVVGLWAARYLKGKVEGPALRWSVLALCALAGGALLVRAGLGG